MSYEQKILARLGGKVASTMAKAERDKVEDPVLVLHEVIGGAFFVAALSRKALAEGMRFNGQPELAHELEQLKALSGVLSIVLTRLDNSVSVIEARMIPTTTINPELN